MIHQHGSTLSPSEISSLEEKEITHIEKVKVFFLSRPNEGFTAEEVHKATGTRNLLSSTRRCLSDLKNAGWLVKHAEEKKDGKYGVRLVTYRHEVVVDNVRQLNLPLSFA